MGARNYASTMKLSALSRVAMSLPHFVKLHSNSPTGLRAQTAGAVEEALHLRTTSLLLGLDGLPILDDAVISESIVALRKLRDVGGTVRLVTGNATHRERLSQLGLDRVFDILANPEEAPS
jgi:anti-anti-sigma regulatory factor